MSEPQISIDGKTISISGDFTKVVLNGVAISIPDSALLLPTPANDAVALVLGQETADGIYAGHTNDGKHEIYALPQDLKMTRTFNDTVKAIHRLNANKDLNLGFNDWQIGTFPVLRVLQRNHREGALKDSFNKGPVAGWYWSSSQHKSFHFYKHALHLSTGNNCYYLTDEKQLSCRPVRLKPAR